MGTDMNHLICEIRVISGKKIIFNAKLVKVDNL